MKLPSDLSLSVFESMLAAYRPREVAFEPGMTRAAVAAVLRFRHNLPEVLLMKRSTRAGDRWSGHVSMPGGRESAADRDLQATAIRETREEVGVDLQHTARAIGRLDTIRAVARGQPQAMSITPFVFLQIQEAPVVLGEEALDAFWLPLGRAATGELTGEVEQGYPVPGARLPCWQYGGHVVWGLTYYMLDQLLEVAAPGLRRLRPSVSARSLGGWTPQ